MVHTRFAAKIPIYNNQIPLIILLNKANVNCRFICCTIKSVRNLDGNDCLELIEGIIRILIQNVAFCSNP